MEAAVGALERGRCTDPAVEAAQHAAHQLAGSLGTFGLGEGSDLARELEDRFDAGGPGATAVSARLRALLDPRLG